MKLLYYYLLSVVGFLEHFVDTEMPPSVPSSVIRYASDDAAVFVHLQASLVMAN